MPIQKAIKSSVNSGLLSLWFPFLSITILADNPQTPFNLSILLFILGTVVWVCFGLVRVRKQLRTIEEKGMSQPIPLARTRAVMLLVGLFAVGIVGIIAIMYVIQYAPFWLFTVSFFAPAPTVYNLTTAISYWLWQCRNKRTLYSTDGKVYPYPYMNTPASKETIY